MKLYLLRIFLNGTIWAQFPYITLKEANERINYYFKNGVGTSIQLIEQP